MHKLFMSWIADRAVEKQPRVHALPEGITLVQPRRGPLWRSLSKPHMRVVFDPAASRGDAFSWRCTCRYLCETNNAHDYSRYVYRSIYMDSLYRGLNVNQMSVSRRLVHSVNDGPGTVDRVCKSEEVLCAWRGQILGCVVEKKKARSRIVSCVKRVRVWQGCKSLYLPRFCKETPETNTSESLWVLRGKAGQSGKGARRWLLTVDLWASFEFWTILSVLSIIHFILKIHDLGLPWWRSGWESACQCRGHGFEPWSGKIPHAVEQLSPCTTTTEPAL